MSKLLDRAAILAADDLPSATVDVPEWGGAVRVRTMTGAERDAYEVRKMQLKLADPDNPQAMLQNFRALLVATTVVDESGNRLFSEADVEALGRKNGIALDRVFDKANALNGITASALKDLKGNSDAGPNDGSPSA